MGADARIVVGAGVVVAAAVSEKASTLEPLESTVDLGQTVPRSGRLESLDATERAPVAGGESHESGGFEAALGARLGAYTIVERIGGGGMGRVYRATHDTLGHSVAIKILKSSAASARGALDKFFFEAKAAANLQHDSIVRAIDFVAESRFGPYIVMEYVSGRALSEVVARGPLPAARTAQIAAKVARALGRAHEAGIIHRDVKPANVMIDEADGDRIKVTDFGIAKTMSAHATGSGTIVGSPYYMAPEQWAGSSADPRTDVFSLGVVLFEMLTGKPPFTGSLREIAEGLIRRAPPDPRTLVPSVPTALASIVTRCMEKEPEARFASMHELAAALDAIAEGESAPARLPPSAFTVAPLPVPALPAPPELATRARSRVSLLVLVLAAATAVAVAVAVAIVGVNARSPSVAALATGAVPTAAYPTPAPPVSVSEPPATTLAPSSAPPVASAAVAPPVKPSAARHAPAAEPEPDVLRAPSGGSPRNRATRQAPASRHPPPDDPLRAN